MTKTRDLSDFLIEGGTDLPTGIPHIVPGVLQPAVAGKDLSGTALGGSYVYGDAHTDGHKYYYTDIKGSRPIKDPRIGAHFGSQRHKFKSLQPLDQETASHGKTVYSTDGRDWIKLVDNYIAFSVSNESIGHTIFFDGNSTSASDSFIEITGYFNDFNMITRTGANRCDDIDAYVNGGSATAVNTLGGRTTQSSPLDGRYVDSGSIVNIGSTVSGLLGTTPKINTLKIVFTNSSSEYLHIGGIELIAQDTTSTARRSEIKIPKQNVVSFGKNFEVGSDDLDNAIHPHYDPFNGFTNGNLAAVQALGIDTATSLGLNKWLLSSTYYRPFNGGRVVKWVDSTGTIKTSVTMMPPNARSIANANNPTNAFAERTTASHFGTNNPMNSFEAGTDLDVDLLSEVSKKFHWREFGNGAGNGGTGSSGYADASMLSSSDDIAFVMDDGLTALAGDDVTGTYGTLDDIAGTGDGDGMYITFIGIGLAITNTYNAPATDTIVQNLPYGSHILRYFVESVSSSTANPDIQIDGVNLGNPSLGNYGQISEITFYQPKRPPIPEDVVVLADYMLMADFVGETGTAQQDTFPKGTRRITATRDFVYDSSGSGILLHHAAHVDRAPDTMTVLGATSAVTTITLPSFSTQFQFQVEDIDHANHETNWAGSADVTNTKVQGANNSLDKAITPVASLGVNSIIQTVQNQHHFMGGWVATPIHTSSHYQAFETPFLKELVGGDRNMEQTNLVCSPDGKTWDEITRDVSYLGESGFSVSSEVSHSATNTGFTTFSMHRGGIDGITLVDTFTVDGTNTNKYKSFYTKDFAPANDRLICLKNGYYQFSFGSHTTGAHVYLYVNGNIVQALHRSHSSAGGSTYGTTVVYLDRGDYVQRKGGYENDEDNQWGLFTCHRINRGVH